MAKKREKRSSRKARTGGQAERESEERRQPSGVRPFWSGTISFGLVNVPVQLFPAARASGVSFRMVDDTGKPLQRRYYCPRHRRDVHPEHILRGYQVEDEEYVIVRDEELEAIEPKKSREIDLRRFVDLAQISPMFFHRSYFLTPRGDSNKAYRLLAEVMERGGRAGIATFVARDREYLVAIVAQGGILRAVTLRFEDELREPKGVGLPRTQPAERDQRDRLIQTIDANTAEQLDTSWLEDDYARRVRQLVNKKRKRRENVVTFDGEQEVGDMEDEEGGGGDVDLLDTIRRSLQRDGDDGTSDRRGPSDGEELENESKERLYDRARRLDIPGRNRMNKRELIREIERAKT